MKELLDRIRRELEVAREKSRRLEAEIHDQRRINEALKYIETIVLHEIRTPLASTTEYVGRLREALRGARRDEADLYMEVVERNIRQINYLLAHLDPAFEIQSNVAVAVDLKPCIRHIYENMIALHGDRVRLINSVPEGFRKLFADPNKFEEILTNLIENAIKYIGAGDRVEVTAADLGDVARIEVRDNGPGIAKEIADSIFKGDFERIILATRRSGKEGGIGLAIVERLVREHGGQIELTSGGGGTAFSLILPFRLIEAGGAAPGADLEAAGAIDAPAEIEAALQAVTEGDAKKGLSAAVQPVPQRRHEGPLRILMVDDDRELLTYLSGGFPAAEFEVRTAGDGPRGLALATEIVPDVITLDVLMVGMNGFEALSYLKSNPVTKAIPVIMISNIRGEGKALKLGAAAFLQKPVNPETLIQLVRRLVGA